MLTPSAVCTIVYTLLRSVHLVVSDQISLTEPRLELCSPTVASSTAGCGELDTSVLRR